MSCELPIRAAGAPSVRLETGFAAAIDEVATDPSRQFLRRAWFAAAGGQDAMTLVGRRADGRPFAALPTVATGPRAFGLRAVPGCYWPFRSFPIAADATDAELASLLTAPAARSALGRGWRLGPVADSDPAVLRLLQIARDSNYRALARRTATSHALDIAAARAAEPWPKPSTQRNMRKHEKKLARLGDVAFRFVACDDWDAAVLDTLTTIERESWAGNRADADPKFVSATMRQCWETMLADPVLRRMLSVGILSIGGAPVAFSFGLDCGRTRYCIATSYDARFAAHSPGYLNGYWTYMAAAERGVELLSLGAGDNGDKASMGAKPEAELIDYLFVRGGTLAALLKPVWR